MWLHRENEYEWKFCGIWLDMIEESDLKFGIFQKLSNVNTAEVFLCFKPYESIVKMVSENLCIRNKIYSIQNNPKLSSVEKEEEVKAIEDNVIQCRIAMSLNKEITIYLNEQARFIKINLS